MRGSIKITDDDSGLIPHPTPTIGASTRIKVELGTLAKWGGCIVAAAVWAWSLRDDVQRLKNDTREMRTESKQMADDIATIKRVVLPPAYASATQEAPRLVLPKASVPDSE